MSPVNKTDQDFAFSAKGIPLAGEYPPPTPAPTPAPPDPLANLGPLEQLVGTWEGTGLNCIWRPHFPAAEHDRFLEINLTSETLAFSPIKGEIPNRGLLQADIVMFGLTYLQQISETATGDGLHIEPGVWATVPRTTEPGEPPTVVRMGSIPHGTVILAQGEAKVIPQAPPIADNNIIPFALDAPRPTNADFATAAATFTELDLDAKSAFRETSPGVTQEMLENPNSLLQKALPAAVSSTTTLLVASTPTPVPGGGTANTAFLAGGNADASQVEATFWIETLPSEPGQPGRLQLQYTQTVMLDFNGLHWPHVTVATLQKTQAPG
jgi:hypothetical protein